MSLSTTLMVGGGVVAVLLVVMWLYGKAKAATARAEVRADQVRVNQRKQEKMDEELGRPDTPADTIDKLRHGGF